MSPTQISLAFSEECAVQLYQPLDFQADHCPVPKDCQDSRGDRPKKHCELDLEGAASQEECGFVLGARVEFQEVMLMQQ